LAMVKNNTHITLGRAWNILRSAIRMLPAEDCPVRLCAGRSLAEDVLSLRNVPHYNASAMDGYAVSSESTAGATPSSPVVLEQGQFSWLNTGGVLPGAFDSVVMEEEASLAGDGSCLSVIKSLVAGENVRPIGEDVFRGQVLARAGEAVTPAAASLFATAGIPSVRVLPRPRSMYVPTGDEIIPMTDWLETEQPPAGRVGESNSLLVAGYFVRWGFPVDVAPCLPDDPEVLSSFLKEKAGEYDLFLVGAGSAKGEKDHTFRVFERHGEPLFRWLLMKPGRPASAALLGGSVVVNLPGFPMSNAVILWSVVYPILQLLQRGNFDDATVVQEALGADGGEQVSLLGPHSSTPGREEWLRLKCVEIDGVKRAYPLPSGAGSLWALAETDALSLLPVESAELTRGTTVFTWFVRPVPWKERILFQGSNDPAMERLPTFVRRYGGDLVLRSVGSLAGLAALSRRECHTAAAHLLNPESGEYNTSFIEGLFQDPEEIVRLVLFFREQGLITKSGNPKRILGVEDLVREDVRIVNRQSGAGTRVLLDALLAEAGIPTDSIRGYGNLSPTHFESANRVALGFADAALGIKSVADALGLGFVPIAEEPFELVYPKEYARLKGVAALLDSLLDEDWRAVVSGMGGYRWP